MARADALERIAKTAYNADNLAEDFEYIATKLDLSVPELQRIMDGKNKSYRDYQNAMPMIELGTKVLRAEEAIAQVAEAAKLSAEKAARKAAAPAKAGATAGTAAKTADVAAAATPAAPAAPAVVAAEPAPAE